MLLIMSEGVELGDGVPVAHAYRISDKASFSLTGGAVLNRAPVEEQGKSSWVVGLLQ